MRFGFYDPKENKIDGFMRDAELIALYLTVGKVMFSGKAVGGEVVVIEVGSWKGRSTHAIASALQQYDGKKFMYCVDGWIGTKPTAKDYRDKKFMVEVYEEFCNNIKGFDFISAMIGNSWDIGRGWPIECAADFIFLDADHSYETVKKDLEAWWPCVKSGGIFMGHDYSASFEGVKQAVNEFFKGEKVFHAPSTSLYWVQKKGGV